MESAGEDIGNKIVIVGKILIQKNVYSQFKSKSSLYIFHQSLIV
jgi:hypothetical protein